MTKRKWKIWFAVMIAATLIFSVANLVIGNYWNSYIEQDPDNNYVTWMGIEYGAGMGSVSFCDRCMAAGIIGIAAAIAETWIFPKYMKMHFEDEEDR